MLVARARRALRREFEARIAAYEVTVPQVYVLRSLAEGDGKTIRELSKLTCSDGPTLTSLLDRMEAKGLISRRRDTSDRRVIRIYLNERGCVIQDAVSDVGQEVLGLALRGMSQRQLDELCDLLLLLCETVEAAHDADEESRKHESVAATAPAASTPRREASNGRRTHSEHGVSPATGMGRTQRAPRGKSVSAAA